MFVRFKQAAFAASVLFVGACASLPAHEALPAEARDKIVNTEVAVPVKQNEIYVFVPDSQVGAATGGGLLGALIDVGINSVRTGKAEDAVKPLRSAVVDYNYDQTLSTEFQKALSQVSWMGVDNVHVIKDVTPAAMDQVFNNSRDGAVLFTVTDYRLSNDADVLSVTVTAALFARSDALRALKPAKSGKSQTALPNSLYHNTLLFETMAPNATSDRPHNIDMWSANNGAALRAALQQGASELAALLASDIQHVQGMPDESKGQRELNNQTGQVIAVDTDGSAMRFKDGTLAYATNSVRQ